MLLGRVTHTAENFKVIQTEELHNFPVRHAPLLHHLRLLPRPTGLCPVRAGPALLLLQESVSHVLQGQTHRGLRQGALPPADGALTPGLLLVPELLQAVPAETVAALEHHRVLEDLAANGTGQLLLQHGARA